MGGIVTKEFERVLVFAGHDLDLRVAVDHGGEVLELAIDAHRERRPREAGADIGGDVRARGGLVELANGAVRQGHGYGGGPRLGGGHIAAKRNFGI